MTSPQEDSRQAHRNDRPAEPSAPSYRTCVRNVRLLQKLSAPRIPEEMCRQDFLDGIYERALADTPAAAKAVTALPPVTAPDLAAGEMVAQEAADQPQLAAQFEDLAAAQAPGWLWQRIREDLRSQRRAQRRPRVLGVRVAAAAVVLLALGLGISLNLKNGGTSVSDDIVIEELDAPLGGSWGHPSDLIRRIGSR